MVWEWGRAEHVGWSGSFHLPRGRLNNLPFCLHPTPLSTGNSWQKSMWQSVGVCVTSQLSCHGSSPVTLRSWVPASSYLQSQKFDLNRAEHFGGLLIKLNKWTNWKDLLVVRDIVSDGTLQSVWLGSLSLVSPTVYPCPPSALSWHF